MPRALKVYCMPAGFYDAVVAAPSQAAALKAWGTTTDLFAAGRASVVTDEAVRAEALARPGEVLKKTRGDEAAMLGPAPKTSRGKGANPKAKAAPAKLAPPKPPPEPPDRSELDAAERAVDEAERERDAELSDIVVERAELDRREIRVRSAAKARLSELTRARDAAGKAFAKALKASGR